MVSKVLVSVVVALAAFAPAASAHTLSKKDARQKAAKVAARLADTLGAEPAYRCTRRTRHKVDCQISFVPLDGSVCVTVVRVKYRSREGTGLVKRIIEPLDCTPPELPILL